MAREALEIAPIGVSRVGRETGLDLQVDEEGAADALVDGVVPRVGGVAC